MPFDRPTLTELRKDSIAEIAAELPGADSALPQSNLRVVSDVLAGLAHGLYGNLAWIADQVIPDTAESAYLERWGDIFGVFRKPPVRAGGTVDMTGLDGSVIPVGTELQSAQGELFAVTAGATVVAGAATVTVESDQPGASGNLAAGATLSLVAAIAGVDADGMIAADLTGGADAESDDALRGRLLARIQAPPHGGAAHDYVAWALEVPGVTRAWVASEMGAGTVTVRFMMDELQAAFQGIPQGTGHPSYSGDLKTVFDRIEPLRPVTAELFIAAPVAVAFDVTVSSLSPDTAAVRAAIAAELEDLLRREAAPGATIFRSKVWEAISIAAGESSHTVDAPAADVTHAAGEIAVLGTITYA